MTAEQLAHAYAFKHAETYMQPPLEAAFLAGRASVTDAADRLAAVVARMIYVGVTISAGSTLADELRAALAAYQQATNA